MSEYYEKLSKLLSHALRHHPEQYGLQLDQRGWVSLDNLLRIMQQHNPYWQNLSLDDVFAMMKASEKQRFEISNNHIRALYGHSLQQKMEMVSETPPKFLFHGTTKKALPKIHTLGLQPMKRQYVHLSIDEKTAITVAERRTDEPVIITVRAANAYHDGIEFYCRNDKVWLVDRLDTLYLKLPF